MNEENYLIISGIHEYVVCPRRWALRIIEIKDGETWRTVAGSQMHKRTHDGAQVEKRGDAIIMRALKVVSHMLGVTGECDVVEFNKDVSGVELSGYKGKYLPFPVEYKRGKAPKSECDKLQLTAQAICLEEMLLCKISHGVLFYGETHRRVDVELTDELRNKVIAAVKEMHELYRRGYTPKAKIGVFCDECALNNECLPKMAKIQPVKDYIYKHLHE